MSIVLPDRDPASLSAIMVQPGQANYAAANRRLRPVRILSSILSLRESAGELRAPKLQPVKDCLQWEL